MFNYVGRVKKETYLNALTGKLEVKKIMIGCIIDKTYKEYFDYYAVHEKGKWNIDLGPSLVDEKYRDLSYTHLVENIDIIFDELIEK
jgi:hypothetical protein